MPKRSRRLPLHPLPSYVRKYHIIICMRYIHRSYIDHYVWGYLSHDRGHGYALFYWYFRSYPLPSRAALTLSFNEPGFRFHHGMSHISGYYTH
ncbi:unnamed protein product [Rhizoctonia solani]|uniref:Uncharacterized protein n=1 Tax=Rhizoctonia solani TaxID=456999 RepID=A0A8H3CF91_9AGAM|nr:unnamed protein product [Rhizoctonia solani]